MAAVAAEARVIAPHVVREVPVALGDRSYPVIVGMQLLGGVGPRLAALGLRGRAAVVTSERVGAAYGAPVVGSLQAAGFQPTVVEIPDGEEHKNLAWLAVVYDRLLEAGIERRSPVVALGGGMVSDLAGFAAATLLRGLPTAIVSTTLVGQVDAAIGGKTGVNHARGKNLLGAFHQPRFVVADVDVLRTLPRREFVAGLAETIKYGAIGDPALFRHLEHHLDEVLSRRADVVARVVATCAAQKAAVVAADEREERGSRAVLNFGHTVGHALEALTDYRELLHGEAVAIGMVAAARVSRALGRCGREAERRIVRLLEQAGLPTEIPRGISPGALAVAMQADKKSADGRIRFVCLEAIGHTTFVELSGHEIVNLL
jgi:3-dehydroquinate synthase